MPFISVRITQGASDAQKAQIIREFTETLQRVLYKDPQHTHIVIEEIAPQNWGHAGETVAALEARGK